MPFALTLIALIALARAAPIDIDVIHMPQEADPDYFVALDVPVTPAFPLFPRRPVTQQPQGAARAQADSALLLLDWVDQLRQAVRHMQTSATLPTPSADMDFEQFKASEYCKESTAKYCFHNIDTNGDGLISPSEMEEYERLTEENTDRMYQKYVDDSFKSADTDSDGFISLTEARKFAQDNLKVAADDQFTQLFDENDVDGDGKLDYTEFSNLLKTWYRSDADLTFIGYAVEDGSGDADTMTDHPEKYWEQEEQEEEKEGDDDSTEKRERKKDKKKDKKTDKKKNKKSKKDDENEEDSDEE